MIEHWMIAQISLDMVLLNINQEIVFNQNEMSSFQVLTRYFDDISSNNNQ